MSISKPKHGGVRDPNNQENNVKYRIYYLIKMTIIEAKTIIKTITDLMLDAKKITADIKETQDKTTLTLR